MTDFERKIRADFPLIESSRCVYLDNGATTQKPECVLTEINRYYETMNANPMRGLYELSVEATEAYENARTVTANFINAQDPREIIFTRNATESLNLVAYSYGAYVLKPGDEVIVSVAEHHSNFLPWVEASKRAGAKVVFFDCAPDGSFDLSELKKLVNTHTKILAVNAVSNVTGQKNDIAAMADIIHNAGGVIVVDGSQSVPHESTDVQELKADFLAFSGHKMYAPMGIGVLYGRKKLLDAMPPFLYGGEMIETVSKERVTYAEVPHKFEAGTVNAGGALGLKAAIEYITKVGFDKITAKERELVKLAVEGMKEIPHVNIIGGESPEDHHGIVSFTIDGVHPHDVSEIFASENIALRAGHHCAEPLHRHLNVMSTTRMSVGMYNTCGEIEQFLDVLKSIRARMGYKDDRQYFLQ